MKKKAIVAGVVVGVLMSITMVNAETIGSTDTGANTSSADVKANYSGGENEALCSVEVTWGAMDFTYKAEGDNVWNPETHEYSTAVKTQWVANGNTVTVVNHSNVPVKADFTYEQGTTFKNVTGSFNVATALLKAGVESKPTEADKIESALTLDGSLSRSQKDETTVGKVKVTIHGVTD